MDTPASCELCGRVVANLTVHHLVPKSRAKPCQVIPTARICPACHRQLHVLYSNHQLARESNCIEDLRRDPVMQRFVRWVRKQDANKQIKVRQG